MHSRVGLVWHKTGVARELEDLRLALRAPEQVRLQLEVLAQEQRRQEERELKAVLLRRGEEAQRTVQTQVVLALRARPGLAHEAMELEPAEELAKAPRALAADRHVERHRAQQYRLGQGDVVTIQQPVGRHVVEANETLLALQVRE